MLRKMFFRLVASVGWRKILGPHEESNLRPSDLRSAALSLSHKEVYYEVHITRVLHTARINNVDSVMFLIEIVEMLSFELGEEDSSWGLRIFLYPTLVTRRKNIFFNSSSSSKLTISTISIKGKCCMFILFILFLFFILFRLFFSLRNHLIRLEWENRNCGQHRF